MSDGATPVRRYRRVTVSCEGPRTPMCLALISRAGAVRSRSHIKKLAAQVEVMRVNYFDGLSDPLSIVLIKTLMTFLLQSMIIS